MKDEPVESQGSFDRYLAYKAPSLLWSSTAARASVLNGGIGLGLCGLSAVLCTVGIAVEGIGGLVFGLGPLIGGCANLWLSRAWRDRSHRNSGEAQLSPQAWDFLHGLTVHILGASYPLRASNLGYYPVSASWNGWRQAPKKRTGESTIVGAPSTKSAREVLEPRVFEMMEEAARHFNRVQGFVSQPATNPGVQPRDANRVQVAATQAMIDAVTIACTMQQFPENIESLRPSLESCTSALREAAELLTALAAPHGHRAEPQEQAVMLRAMLEDLRIENLARSELNEMDHTSVEQRRLEG